MKETSVFILTVDTMGLDISLTHHPSFRAMVDYIPLNFKVKWILPGPREISQHLRACAEYAEDLRLFSNTHVVPNNHL